MERNVRCITERLGIQLIASRRNNDFNLHNKSMLNRTKLSLSVFRLFLLPLEKIDDETVSDLQRYFFALAPPLSISIHFTALLSFIILRYRLICHSIAVNQTPPW